MTEPFDPFAPSTGLIDDFDFTIDSARFVFDANYNNGQTLCLRLEGRTDNPQKAELDQLYPCGSGWDVANGGREAVREDGKPKGFNNSSTYYAFIAAALAVAGDELRSRMAGDHPKGPMDATIWEGLTLHLKQNEIDYGGEIGKKNRLLPTGLGGVAKAATNGNGNGAGIPASVKGRLLSMASCAASFDEFVTTAYSQMSDEIDASEDVTAAVTDEAGIWAEAKA